MYINMFNRPLRLTRPLPTVTSVTPVRTSPRTMPRTRPTENLDRVPTESRQSPDSPTVVNRQSPTEPDRAQASYRKVPCMDSVRLCQAVNRQTDRPTDRQPGLNPRPPRAGPRPLRIHHPQVVGGGCYKMTSISGVPLRPRQRVTPQWTDSSIDSSSRLWRHAFDSATIEEERLIPARAADRDGELDQSGSSSERARKRLFELLQRGANHDHSELRRMLHTVHNVAQAGEHRDSRR